MAKHFAKSFNKEVMRANEQRKEQIRIYLKQLDEEYRKEICSYIAYRLEALQDESKLEEQIEILGEEGHSNERFILSLAIATLYDVLWSIRQEEVSSN